MYAPTERLQHLDISCRGTAIIPIVFRLCNARCDGRYDLLDVKVENLVIDFARWVGCGGNMQQRGEG